VRSLVVFAVADGASRPAEVAPGIRHEAGPGFKAKQNRPLTQKAVACARSPPKETCDIMLTRQVDQLHELTLQLVELERVQLDIAVHREAQADRFGTAVCHLHRKATSSSSMPNQRT
jgi:hypothetical protein